MCLVIRIKTVISKSYLDKEEGYKSRPNKYHNWTEFLIFRGLEKKKRAEGCKGWRIYRSC